MQRTKNQPVRKQLGVLIDEDLWRKFKAQAVMKGLSAAAHLEDAMKKALKECE